MRRRVIIGLVVGALLLAASLTPAKTTKASASLPAAESSVVADNGHLALEQDGTVQPYDFTGINAYTLTSLWGVNWGCGWGGWTPSLLDEFFSSLAPNTIVRTWFFQQTATQITPSGSVRNWTALDQVVQEADKYHVHLVAVLGNQDGTCDDGHWKDESWYAGGYNQVWNQGYYINGTQVDTTTTSYAQWVHDVVSRYVGNPAIAMWEPINEPQALDCTSIGSACWSTPWGPEKGCPDEATANAAMRSFFDTIGGEIHQLDPGTLVSDGSLGTGSCGESTTADFENVIASPGIDVVGYHDYSGQGTPVDLLAKTQEAEALGKPMMVGESGVTGCGSAANQAEIYQSKMQSAFAAGVSAYLLWWYDGDGGDPTCDSPIDTDSPTWAVMGQEAHATGPAAPLTTSPTSTSVSGGTGTTTTTSTSTAATPTAISSSPTSTVTMAGTPSTTSTTPATTPPVAVAPRPVGGAVQAVRADASSTSSVLNVPSSTVINPAKPALAASPGEVAHSTTAPGARKTAAGAAKRISPKRRTQSLTSGNLTATRNKAGRSQSTIPGPGTKHAASRASRRCSTQCRQASHLASVERSARHRHRRNERRVSIRPDPS